MPDINMQHFEELQRNQHSINVEIDASQVASPQHNFPMMLETPNSANSTLNIVAINEFGEQLPTEIEGISNDKNWIHLKDLVHSSWNCKMKVFYSGSVGKPATNNIYGSQAVWTNEATYHMNQNPNGDAANSIKDSTSNANHGTPKGSMTTADLVDSVFGKAINFDGSNDAIDTGVAMNGANAFTFIQRIKITDKSVLQNFLGAMDATANRLYAGVRNGNYWSAVGGTQKYTVSAAAITNNVDFTFTFVGNGAGTMTYFVNGVEVDNSAYSDAGLSSYSQYISALNVAGATNNPSNAIISEHRIVLSELSDNYISTTHNNLNNPTASGFNPFYKLISKEHNFAESLQSLGRAG